MLTSIAILERELGSIDFARHMLERAGTALSASQQAEMAELGRRRQRTLEVLEDLHDQRQHRQPDAGRSARARPTRRRAGSG